MSETETLPTRGLRTPNSALKALKKVIKGREDYVYAPQGGNCVYVHHESSGPTPGCLIGHVLHDAGVPLEWLAAWDDGAFGNGDSSAALVINRLGLPDGVRDLFAAAQGAQDQRMPWDASVDRAAATAGL